MLEIYKSEAIIAARANILSKVRYLAAKGSCNGKRDNKDYENSKGG